MDVTGKCERLALPWQCQNAPHSAHVCSEIGLKWFLFAFHDLRKISGFISVLDFFEQMSS
jgi:hypothetical protein